MKNNKILTAEIFINATAEKVWALWTLPEHIRQWNNASEDWHTPYAENDLRTGGKLLLRMEKKDGSESFDYACIYTEVLEKKKISHTGYDDNRKTSILFSTIKNGIQLTEIFEPTTEISTDLQQAFCQSILNNFKKYVENSPLQL